MRAQPNIQMMLDSLMELTSREEQERLWLSTGASGAEVSSPDEAICALFDDSGLGDALDWAWVQRQGGRDVQDTPVYTIELDARIKALRTILGRLPPGSVQEVIDTPIMEEVRLAAARLLSDLQEWRASG